MTQTANTSPCQTSAISLRVYFTTVNGTIHGDALPLERAEAVAAAYRRTYRRAIVRVESVESYREWAPDTYARALTHSV